MNEREKYNKAEFEIWKNTGTKKNYLLAHLPKEINYISPETEVCSGDNGKYIGRIIKLSTLNPKNPDLIYGNYNEKPIGFFVGGKVQIPNVEGLSTTNFNDPIKFLIDEYDELDYILYYS